MSSCAILIDTNVALHFLPIDQIDWPGIAQCKSCVLIVAPVLLRELEHQKIFNRSAVLRDRASKRIDFLVQKMAEPDPISLRPHVELRFIDHESSIDFVANRLVREVQDDHYIASALEVFGTTDLKTFVASNDGGMALKLRSRPIQVLRLPDELRLPADLDPDQKELRDAKLLIARLQSQRPKVALRFANGGTHRTIRNAQSLPGDLLSPERIRLENPLLSVPVVKSGPFDGDIASIGMLRAMHGFGSIAAIKRYNAALPRFYEEYQRYFHEMTDWLESLRLTTRLEVELCNEGTATATNVDVTLSFPPTVKVQRERDRRKEPKAPTAPLRPDRPLTRDALLSGIELPRTFLPDLDFYDGAISVDCEAGAVEFSAKNLKQKCNLVADHFLITRDASLTNTGIEIDVKITFNEAEPVSQKLSLTFKEVPVEESDD